jgi:hypothetical protein
VPPEGPALVIPSLPAVAPGSYAIPPSIHRILDPLRTTTNRFGLLREYPYRPSFDPDASILYHNQRLVKLCFSYTN